MASDPAAAPQSFTVVQEKVLHNRYLHLFDRGVRYPDSNVHHFDVVGHPKSDFSFTVTFPFDAVSQEAIVVREYSQGPNMLMYCFPSGGYDKRKHDSLESCARAELHEEGQLVGGELVPLLKDGTGLIETKWCINKFYPYLVINPKHEESGAEHRDAEEAGMTVHRVSIAELKSILMRGELQTPSICTFYLGLDELARRGLLR